MHYFKSSVFLTLFVLFTFSVNAQFSIFAGPQITTAYYRVQGKNQETKSKPGFHLGLRAKIPFETNLYFVPSVSYSMKGYKVTLTQHVSPPDANAINNNATIHAIDLAPFLQFDFSPEANHFYLRGGPMIDVIFAGNEKYDRTDGISVDRPMKFSMVDYGRFTSNAVGEFGYETSKMFISAHVVFGLGSLNNADFGPRIKNRVFGISIGKAL